MPASQRGCTKALVGLGIFLIADADVLAVEQTDDGSEHGFPGEGAALEVSLDLPPQPRQCFAELEQAFIFGAFAFGAELGVIAILLAASGIHPRRLQMTLRIGTEPGLF